MLSPGLRSRTIDRPDLGVMVGRSALAKRNADKPRRIGQSFIGLERDDVTPLDVEYGCNMHVSTPGICLVDMDSSEK